MDPKLKVLLIEAGESKLSCLVGLSKANWIGNLNNPWVYRPGIFPRNMKLDSKTASFYYSKPSEHLLGRRAIVPCANM